MSRDVQKAYGRGYDPEFCYSLVNSLARSIVDGEYPSLSFVSGDKRKAKKYIQALQDIFFLRRFTVHEHGTGNDHWVFGDSGLAHHLAPQKNGEGVLLSLARHLVLNEIFCFCEYQDQPLQKIYFKSGRGSVVDLVWNNIPIRIIAEAVSSGRLGFYERAVAGAMKTLKSPRGIIVAPTNSLFIEKKGISVVPWTYWS